ncbi:MAG: type II toxin-antitoxin system PemK/MazF family toxin [Saprospiraceae bacterium]|nr:type II toxin-antitoxin system PemK/MazF family toxin [Saprospiraceae bacterium]
MGAKIQKSRPAVIVNDDAIGILPLKVIVPITAWKPQYGAASWMVKLEPDAVNNLSKPSAADCFQVRSVSKLRLVHKIGNVSSTKLTEIEVASKSVLKIS